jgi:hypothetical protein
MNTDNATATIEIIQLDGTTVQLTYPMIYFQANVKFWQDRFFNGSIMGWKVI